MTFGQRLKELRTEKRMTQDDLGKVMNVSKASISLYEKNERTPDQATLIKTADYFDVSLDFLLGRSDKRHYYDLSEKETTDIAEQAEKMLKGMDTGAAVNFYGEPMTDEQKQSMRDILEMGLRINKEKAKKKFTPKKYRGGDGE